MSRVAVLLEPYGGIHVRSPWLTLVAPLSKIVDFNGDGYGDIVIGAPGADLGNGRAYVLFGNESWSELSFDVSDLENTSHAGLVLAGTEGGTYTNNIGYAVAGAG